ncbi:MULTISPECIES: hypothetical protein [unclassified Methanoculleus]|uniref:hypothetical protein n=1 Tax=unclassified Methanoculleus TaxID=2619537 RepID=UPI0025F96C21|nr:MULTISPECIES: hypothetical protein [unclassified Methanoculleus]
MADLYVLASIPDQGKTTAAILLEKQLRSEGKRVACLQTNKGQNDVHRYLFEDCYHYSVPLEAARSKSAFEQWVPAGYDAYIMEITFAYAPLRAVYVDLFENINEVISYDARENWKEYVSDFFKQLWSRRRHGIGPSQDLMAFWDRVHDRNVQTILTKTPAVLDGPCVGTDKILYHADQIAAEPIEPEMELPKGSGKVIAVGSFPAEYWDIFPSLTWFRFDYAAFMERLREEKYDIAIIGASGADKMKLQDRPDHGSLICYQPALYLDLERKRIREPLSGDYHTLFSTIKQQPPGTPLCPEGEPFCQFNNRFWVHQKYVSSEPVWRDGNTVFCNGWVLPQYLIRDGFLEV